jgi:hypothetical protein
MQNDVPDLSRVSRFETVDSVLKLGAWLAVRADAVALLDAAVAAVAEPHVFPLLCVMDASLKFGPVSRDRLSPHMPRWLRRLPVMGDGRMAQASETIVMHWVTGGVVDTACAAVALVPESVATGPRVHRCHLCKALFRSEGRRDAHVYAHAQCHIHKLRVTSTQTSRDHVRFGVFYTLDLAKRVQEAADAPVPRCVTSPLPVHPEDTAVCVVCGETMSKEFSEVLGGWTWEGCRRFSGLLLHDECRDGFRCISSKKRR